MEGLSGVLVFTSLFGTLCILLSLWWTRKLDGSEPPVVRSKVPFFGHAIQLFWQGSVYFIQLRYQFPSRLVFEQTNGV